MINQITILYNSANNQVNLHFLQCTFILNMFRLLLLTINCWKKLKTIILTIIYLEKLFTLTNFSFRYTHSHTHSNAHTYTHTIFNYNIFFSENVDYLRIPRYKLRISTILVSMLINI